MTLPVTPSTSGIRASAFSRSRRSSHVGSAASRLDARLSRGAEKESTFAPTGRFCDWNLGAQYGPWHVGLGARSLVQVETPACVTAAKICSESRRQCLHAV